MLDAYWLKPSTTDPDVASQNVAQGQVGKLCTETNTFIIDPALGELEFEAEENEISLTVDNMNGEWGIFIPQTGNTTNTATNSAGAGSGDSSEGAGETDVNGTFDTAVAVPGANAKTDIQFTPGVSPEPILVFVAILPYTAGNLWD